MVNFPECFSLFIYTKRGSTSWHVSFAADASLFEQQYLLLKAQISNPVHRYRMGFPNRNVQSVSAYIMQNHAFVFHNAAFLTNLNSR